VRLGVTSFIDCVAIVIEQSFLTSLIVPQLVKKFSALYVTGKFTTAYTRPRDLFLSRARLIYSTSSQAVSWRCILILFSQALQVQSDM